MSKDEVEINREEAGEDYEVVPIGPIRKLERRIDEMEQQKTESGNDELVKDVLDIMKSNQKIVNEMTQSTHELKNSVEDLTHKMDDVVDNMNSFMDLLEEASEADLEGEVISDVHSRIADAVGSEMHEVAEKIAKSNNQVVENLENLNRNLERSGSQGNVKSPGLDIDRGGTQRNSERRNEQMERNDQKKGNNIERNEGGRTKQSSGDSERMRKLRKRFESTENEQ